MASTNVNFRMDEQLKHNVEDICARMGLTLTTALTMFCKKMEQERRIPFEVTADPDPLYREGTVRELRRRLDDVKSGAVQLETHDLMED